MTFSTSAKRQLSDQNSQGTSLGVSSSDLISFYGKTCIAQQTVATTASAVTTTASVSTSPFGFTTSTQANAIITTLNAVIVDLASLHTALASTGIIV